MECRNFIKKHPLLTHLFMIAVVCVVLVWGVLFWLDIWTGHGKVVNVPDVKGMTIAGAREILALEKLTLELNDSVYEEEAMPGTIVDQLPRKGERVKPGRTVYLTINAFSPKTLAVPELSGVSYRQARSVLESLGFNHVTVRYVPSEYKDLVLSVKFNGVPLRAGTRLPVSATITIEVGEGSDYPGDSIPTEVSQEHNSDDDFVSPLVWD